MESFCGWLLSLSSDVFRVYPLVIWQCFISVYEYPIVLGKPLYEHLGFTFLALSDTAAHVGIYLMILVSETLCPVPSCSHPQGWSLTCWAHPCWKSPRYSMCPARRLGQGGACEGESQSIASPPVLPSITQQTSLPASLCLALHEV